MGKQKERYCKWEDKWSIRGKIRGRLRGRISEMIRGRVSERVSGKISVTIKRRIKGRFIHMITSSIGFWYLSWLDIFCAFICKISVNILGLFWLLVNAWKGGWKTTVLLKIGWRKLGQRKKKWGLIYEEPAYKVLLESYSTFWSSSWSKSPTYQLFNSVD